jgi:hypothetical protein
MTLLYLYLPLPLYLYLYTYVMAAATTATAIPPPFFSPYLDDQSGKIQAKGVPWEVRVMSSSVDNLSTDY